MTNSFAAIEIHGLCTDAGASARGATMGPEALRIAGLIEALSGLGHSVVDKGDVRLPPNDRSADKRRAEILALASEASNRGHGTLKSGGFPLFLGGDH